MRALGSPRARIIGATALCIGVGGVILPLSLRALFVLPPGFTRLLLLAYVGGACWMTLVVAVTAWVALWPATPYLDLHQGEQEPRGADPGEAKQAALGFPSWIATAGTIAGELATAAGWMYMTVAGYRNVPTLSLSLITATMVGLAWLLLYALGQRAVAPLLHRLQDVHLQHSHFSPEPGMVGRLGYAFFIMVCAGVVPAAMLAGAYLGRVRDAEVRGQRERTVMCLQHVVAGLGSDQARVAQVLESVPLSSELTIVLAPARQPASPPIQARRGAVLDDDPPPPTEVLLPGGRTAQVTAPEAPQRFTGLIITMALLLGLCVIVGQRLAALIARDVAGLIRRVQGLSRARASEITQFHTAHPPEIAEALQVSAALDRLMDRMRRLHVESYLAIERTVDARRAKSQFLASMSHDLRSPLSSVLGFSELLSSGYEGDIPDQARGRLLHLHQTGRRLLRLLSEILDTAKVESQTIELHPRRCAPADLLAQAVSDARRGRMHEDLPVVLDVPAGLRPINVDPLRFPQALAHLIGHVLEGASLNFEASDFGDRVDPDQPYRPPVQKIQVRVSAREVPMPVGVQVPGERVPSAFEVTVTVERAPGARGLIAGGEPRLPLGTVGLGLALPLARRLFALHGGTIEVVPGQPTLRATVPLRTPAP